MNFFNDYTKAFKAEWLKLRNSGVFWLVLIMAAFIPAIFTLVGLLADEDGITSITRENPWKSLFTNNFQGFGIFFYPVFLTLVVIRLTQMEHRGGGWKLIEVQPISRLSLYLGKFSIAVVVALFCIVALSLYILLSGTIIMLAKPGSDFSKFSIPFDFISRLGLRLLISGLGVLGIQYLFSVVISGFIGPFAIGLVGTIAGTIFLGFGKLLWWPYIAPAQSVTNPDGSPAGNLLMYYEWLSIAWMVIALWLGYQWYQRKTFQRAFFKPVTRLLYVLIPAALFAAFFIFINRPVQLSSHNRTLIAGTLEAKDDVNKIYVIAEPLMDTILEIPVTNNSFQLATDKKIPTAAYLFKAGNMDPVQVFFGTNDSVVIKLRSDGRSIRLDVTGNRLPENEFIRRGGIRGSDSYNSYYLENYGYEFKPSAFAGRVLKLWKNDMEKIENYKTADNLKPAGDFIALQKKLKSLYYLKLLDSRYAQWYRVYHPNETLEYPKSVEAIRNTVNYSDSTLLSY
ncbi:MAG TPA: ABC transporter permease, partial [Chitinophagaceae bacterium]|nr:ABC transporter permease [Chitinophagaceae bacterium]